MERAPQNLVLEKERAITIRTLHGKGRLSDLEGCRQATTGDGLRFVKIHIQLPTNRFTLRYIVNILTMLPRKNETSYLSFRGVPSYITSVSSSCVPCF